MLPSTPYLLQRPPVSAWSPAKLSNIISWWRSDLDTFSDLGTTPAAPTDPVEQINDQVGSNNLVNAGASGTRPVQAASGLDFTATSGQFLKTPINGVTLPSGSLYAFAALRMRTGCDQYGRALSYATATQADSAGGVIFVIRTNTTNAIESYRSGDVSSQAISLDTTVRFLTVFDGTNCVTYLNNANATSTAKTLINTGTGTIAIGPAMQIGGSNTSPGFWDGVLYEFGIGGSSSAGLGPSDTERANLDAWLSRWS